MYMLFGCRSIIFYFLFMLGIKFPVILIFLLSFCVGLFWPIVNVGKREREKFCNIRGTHK